MPDATTQGQWDDVPPKATEVLDPALEEIKWGLEETMRARDAEIRELKAEVSHLRKILEQLVMAFDGLLPVQTIDKTVIVFESSRFGGWAEDAPELTRYLCERNGWPNPLEGGEG